MRLKLSAVSPLAATAVALAVLLLPACTSDSGARSSSTNSSNPPEGQHRPTAMSEQQDVVSMADRQVQGMKGELDVTTVEEFTDQMPVGFLPTIPPSAILNQMTPPSPGEASAE